MPNTVEVVDLRQRVPDDAPLAEPGRKALVEERQARKAAERAAKQLTARVEALESRKGPDLDRLLDGIAAIRSELRADQGRLRAEVHELAEGLEQVRAMVAAD
jgi:hypothetical protein